MSIALLLVLVASMVGVFMMLMNMVAKEQKEIVEAMTEEPEKFKS